MKNIREYSELEAIIITNHEKDFKRGIAIYFGINELNELEKNGVNLRNNRRFLNQTTIDKKIVLIALLRTRFFS